MIERTRRLARELRDLPRLALVGLVGLLLAGVLDIVVHLVGSDHAGHSTAESVAHVSGIVGMVLVLAGVVLHGVRRQFSRRRTAASNGGTRHATR